MRGMMPASDNVTVVYPQAGNAVFHALARRLADAGEEAGRSVVLLPASSVCALGRRDLAGKMVLIVQPGQCSRGLPDRDAFLQRLSEARKRVAVCAEPAGSAFFENQFKVAIDFDAIIDIGFLSQADQLKNFGVPYLFLFNGPTREDASAIEETSVSGRPICWSLVGHAREDRVRLAHDLADALDPGGLVFLPPRGVVIQQSRGMIAAEGLNKLLRKTRFYIWASLHEVNYYESFRFREAILAGAVPCKMDPRTGWESADVPGIFPSVDSLRESIENNGYETLCEEAKAFYLSQDLLSDGLREALERV